MPKHTTRQHKTAIRHAPAARRRRHGKALHGNNPAPAVRQSPAIALAEFKPTVIDVVEFDFRSEPDEVMADDTAVTGFEDEDL